MYAIVKINKKKASVIITEIDNINWEDKEIIDNSELMEKEYYLEDIIVVWDILNRRKRTIKVINLDTNNHRIIIEKKMYLTLNVIG